MKKLIAAVRRYALDHRDTGNWDIVIEMWEDRDVANVIGAAMTEEEAIRRVRRAIAPVDEFQNLLQAVT